MYIKCSDLLFCLSCTVQSPFGASTLMDNLCIGNQFFMPGQFISHSQSFHKRHLNPRSATSISSHSKPRKSPLEDHFQIFQDMRALLVGSFQTLLRLMTHTARRVFAAFSPRYREDYPATHSAFSPRIRCQICAGELDCSDVAGSA